MRNIQDPRRQGVRHQEFIKYPPKGSVVKAPHLSRFEETADGLPSIVISDLKNQAVGRLFLSKTPDLLYRIYLVDKDTHGGPYLGYNEAVWRCFEMHRNKMGLKAFLRKKGKLID